MGRDPQKDVHPLPQRRGHESIFRIRGSLGAGLGGIPEKSNLYGPLACIINLKQSKTTSYRTIQKTDAYLRLMRQIITSRDFYPSQDDLAAILERNAEFGERVINAVPCYEMEFTLDRESFWEEIDQLEAELPLKISTQAIS